MARVRGAQLVNPKAVHINGIFVMIKMGRKRQRFSRKRRVLKHERGRVYQGRISISLSSETNASLNLCRNRYLLCGCSAIAATAKTAPNS